MTVGITSLSEFEATTWSTLVLSTINGVNGPHAMHDVHSPVLALFVQDLSPRLRSQFWHAPDHVGVPLQEISLLEMSQVYVGEILSQIICLELNMGTMSL